MITTSGVRHGLKLLLLTVAESGVASDLNTVKYG